MNPYQIPVTCEVCGEEGLGTIRCAGAAWDSNYSVRHANPSICAENLKIKKEKLKSDLIKHINESP